MYLYPFILIFFISAVLFFNTRNKNNKNNKILIDVRTKQEWLTNKLNNSINIPYDQIHTLNINKGTNILLYCNSGKRAKIAKNVLERLGYKDVQVLTKVIV